MLQRPVVRRLPDLAVAAAGLAAAALNCSFVLAPLTASQLNPWSSVLSELEARDQPASGLFRGTDLATGLLVMVFAYGLRRRLPPGRAGCAGVWALGGYGLGAVADALLPLDCAPSADPGCHARELAGLVSWQHQAHTVSSVVGNVAVLASLLLLGWHLARMPPWRLAGRVGLAGFVLLGPLTLLLAVLTLRDAWGDGVVQRVQVALLSAWLVILAVVGPVRAARRGAPP